MGFPTARQLNKHKTVRAETPVKRVMLHIDMDAFFAAIEERDNPRLCGKPVVIGGGPRRGVVTTANYVARQFGIRSGMPSSRAFELCPQAIFLPVDGRKYVHVSRQVMETLEHFSPDMRPMSIDEASLDITGCLRLFDGAENLGRELKQRIYQETCLACTVGIGTNPLVAKMAAELGKPDGLLIVPEGKARELFAPLPVKKMIGIGPATTEALEKLNIRTLGELAAAPERLLKARFGVIGPVLQRMSRGEWVGRMRQDEERRTAERSMGHQRTFGDNLVDLDDIKSKLIGLAEMVARRLRRANVVGHVLTLMLRYDDFETIHHQSALCAPTDDEAAVIKYGWRLLNEIIEVGRPVRLLGLSMGKLRPKVEDDQLDLFTGDSQQRRDDLYRALDDLRDRFGERIITRAMGRRFRIDSRKKKSNMIVPLRFYPQ